VKTFSRFKLSVFEKAFSSEVEKMLLHKSKRRPFLFNSLERIFFSKKLLRNSDE
jgi:hypothetical protein